MKDIIFIGIDISQQNNTVHAMDSAGGKLWHQTFENSLAGSQQLVKWLIETGSRYGSDFLSIGLEATGCYGDLVAIYLR